MSRFPRRVLLLSLALYAVAGLSFLVAPAWMAGIVDLSLASVTADNDVRAVYGGVPLGIAAFLLWCLRSPARYRAGLVVVLATLAAMASARVLSWLVAGLPGPAAWALHATEVLGLVLALLALRRLPREA